METDASTREEVRQAYSLSGARYDEVRLEEPRGRLLSAHDLGLFERLLPNPVGPQARALEVGAGTGRFTLPMLERGHRVVASDANEAQLAVLREKLQARGLEGRCEVRVEDVFDLSFEDASFDLVVSIHVVPRFLTWEDQRAALRELCRVVKPGGQLLVNFRNRRSPYNLVYRGPAADPRAVATTLREAGLVVQEHRTKHLLNGRLLDRMPRLLWQPIARLDRALETRWPGRAWDVFLRAKRSA